MARTFPIAPAALAPILALFMTVAVGIAPAWVSGEVPVVVVAVPIGVAVALLRSALATRRARFEVSPEALVLHGDWWGRAIPRASLRVDQARIVDLALAPALEPDLRTWGTGLPGYAAGWFALSNGDPALVYLTDRRRVVVVPTRLGFTLLLTPTDPEAFIAALR